MNPKRWEHFQDDRFGFEEPPQTQRCQHPGCDAPGEYRAPKNRARDLAQENAFGLFNDRYWHFCLEHVRAYNQAWNYYEGMSDSEIAANQRADLLWNRATHPFGNVSPERARREAAFGTTDRANAFDDPFEIFDSFINDNPTGAERQRPVNPARRLPREIRYALELFDLSAPVSPEEVKRTYKRLAKRYHPDLNGGSTADEERLKAINDAYQHLKEGVYL